MTTGTVTTDVAARAITHVKSFYWNDAQTAALTLGSVGAVVLPHHSEEAAYDRGQLDTVFGALVDPDVHLPPLGYVEVSDVFYKVGPESRYDDAAGFHRLEEVEAYDGGVRAVVADAHKLVAVEMTDPVGNSITADVDYHLLAPFRVSDANGTVQEIDYDPLAMARRTSRYGHAMNAASSVVDHGFDALTLGAALPTFADALDDPEGELGGAETLLLYEFPTGGAPMRTLTLAAEQFVDRGPDAPDGTALPARARVSIAYVDGFGRPLQGRTLVEAGIAWVEDGEDLVEEKAEVRWLVTGHVVLDAKQLARATYEPFFRDEHEFEVELSRRQFGVATATTFDALGRPVEQTFPNATLSTTTYTPWHQETSDPNDSIGLATAYSAERSGLDPDEPEKIALVQAEANAETPISSHVDPLGRPISSVEVIEDDEVLVEQAALEVRGLSQATTDRRELTASTRAFDRLGRVLSETSMDAGTHKSLFDAEGREVHHWHESTEEERVYDLAGRMTERHVTESSTTWLAERFTYGEGASGAVDRNQRGRVILVEDAAGTVASTRYGAFGEVLESTRTLLAAAGTDPDWGGSPTLEGSGYTSKAAFDAMGRRTRGYLPDSTERRHEYHRSGASSKVQIVTPDTTVRTILESTTYNARGQETHRELGNDVEVSSTYDAETFRLYRRHAVKGGDTYQDLRHHYDPVGNVVYIHDLAQADDDTDDVIQGLEVSAERVFKYDARYQLMEASGRVHSALARADYRGDTPTSGSYRGTRRLNLNDGTAVTRYTREYSYDDGGNLLGWEHSGTSPGTNWLNQKWVSSTSNRSYLVKDLAEVDISNPADKFNARGQIIELPNLRSMVWSARDQLRKTVLIERTSPNPNDDELYDYAADGTRLRKTMHRLVSGNVETTEMIYLGECEFRRVTQTVSSVDNVIIRRWTSHVEGADGRLATVYRWDEDELARETSSTPGYRTHFHLGSHQSSTSVELDGSGNVLSYEEYFPYGGTAFVAATDVVGGSFRTLRFVGKDQDDTTGFYVFHFRYYAPYIGSWVSPDPAGEVDGPNLYAYCRNNPVTMTDRHGLQADDEAVTGTVTGDVILARPEDAAERGRMDEASEEAYAIAFYNREWGRGAGHTLTDLEFSGGSWHIPEATRTAWARETVERTLSDDPLRGLGSAPPVGGGTGGSISLSDGGGDSGPGLTAAEERRLEADLDEIFSSGDSDDPLAGLPGISTAPAESRPESDPSTGSGSGGAADGPIMSVDEPIMSEMPPETAPEDLVCAGPTASEGGPATPAARPSGGRPEEPGLWDRGGSTIATGLLLLGGAALGLLAITVFAPVGIALAIAALGVAMGGAAGVAVTAVGAIELGTDVTGISHATPESHARMTEAVGVVSSLASPEGMVGGTAGLLAGGTVEDLHTGSTVAGLIPTNATDAAVTMGALGLTGGDLESTATISSVFGAASMAHAFRARSTGSAGGLVPASEPRGRASDPTPEPTTGSSDASVHARASDARGRGSDDTSERMIRLFHGTSPEGGGALYSGGVRAGGRAGTDFGPGFYTSSSRDVALRAAGRSTTTPVIVEFEVPESALARLSGRHFEGATDEWAAFVMYNRTGAGSVGPRATHPYDVVSGPMFGRVRSTGEVLPITRGRPPALDWQLSVHTEAGAALLNRSMVRSPR